MGEPAADPPARRRHTAPKRRLHHIGRRTRRGGTRVSLLVHDLHIRVIGLDSGELIRKLTLGPTVTARSADYRPAPKKDPAMQRCPETPVNDKRRHHTGALRLSVAWLVTSEQQRWGTMMLCTVRG
jgi:hypothetical protein